MAAEGAAGMGGRVARRDDSGERIERIALALPAGALVAAAMLTALAPRLGLLGGAFVLGWTQLVGV